MAKSDMPEVAAIKAPAPMLRLEDKYLAEYLPGGLKMNVGDEVKIEATYKVRKVSSGKEYDDKTHDCVELELVSTDEKAEGGKDTEDEDMKGKMRRMQGRAIGVMITP